MNPLLDAFGFRRTRLTTETPMLRDGAPSQRQAGLKRGALGIGLHAICGRLWEESERSRQGA